MNTKIHDAKRITKFTEKKNISTLFVDVLAI